MSGWTDIARGPERACVLSGPAEARGTAMRLTHGRARAAWAQSREVATGRRASRAVWPLGQAAPGRDGRGDRRVHAVSDLAGGRCQPVRVLPVTHAEPQP